MGFIHRFERLVLGTAAILLLCMGCMASAAPARLETVVVPLKLDYPLLRHLMIQQLFDPQTRRVDILRDPAGCSKIFLSDPNLGQQEGRLKVTAHVDAQIATALFGTCTGLFNWSGDAEFLAEPMIQPSARAVRLDVQSTRLYDAQGKLLNSGPLWDMAEGKLRTYLSRYQVDLAPSIDEISKFLPQILRSRSAQQLGNITSSLKLADIRTTRNGLDVDVSLQVDRLPASASPEAALTQDEMRQLEAKWQMMDAMITSAVKQYAEITQRQDLRDALLEVLLDARYALLDAMTQPVKRSDDPVRHWFIESWQRLGPLLRSIGMQQPGQEPMLIVSLLTATDMLQALDRLGPTVGLEISTDGLRRMGRMLIEQPGIDPLKYDFDIDPQLRGLFGLPDASRPVAPTSFRFDLWPMSNAWAGSSNERLNLWVPKKQELPQYLPVVRELLLSNADKVVKDEELEDAVGKLYRRIVLTTAWQESCWRQFVVEKQKIVPLRSNTGDSGLMQLNERVWRGLYDPNKLRWDVDYNTRAGAEVLAYYMTKYALKRGEQKQKGGWDNLARATYSAYNGGPGQTSRYRNPKASAGHRKIDTAFWKKYQAVKQGKELQVAECLGGDAEHVAAVSEQSVKPKAEPNAKPHPKPVESAVHKSHPLPDKPVGKDWLLKQAKQHYTLQLAVFSSRQAAQKFSSENKLQGTVAIVALGGDKQGQYVVLNGSYPNRTGADKQKRRYAKLKPWVRQFEQILPTIKR